MNGPALLDKFERIRPSGGQWLVKCPAHEDRRNSLAVRFADDGHVLFCCHAGCSTQDIVRHLGLTMRDLMPETERRQVVKRYDYRDEKGTLLYQVERRSDKSFCQRRPNGGGWTYKLDGVRRVLYRLPELLASKGIVYIPEGEKDVERLASLGLTATCNAGGAGKWRAEYAQSLKGRVCVVLPDNDPPGEEHARTVASTLEKAYILRLPGLPPKGDVSDWLENHTAKELQQLAEKVSFDWREEILCLRSKVQKLEARMDRAARLVRDLTARLERLEGR